jgi:uncharacterized protein (DUF433 family)
MPQTVPGFDRLTIEPEKLGGQPCIRGFRMSAEQLLDLLAADWTVDALLDAYPFLEMDDIRQVLGYAATLAHREFYIPAKKPA